MASLMRNPVTDTNPKNAGYVIERIPLLDGKSRAASIMELI